MLDAFRETIGGVFDHVEDQIETMPKTVVRIGHFGDTLVAVERNREIIPRAQHAIATLNEGDTLEVVHFVGGG